MLCHVGSVCVFIAPDISWPKSMASNKRDPLCATMIGSAKAVCVCVCVFGNSQRRPIQCCAMSVRCVSIAPGISWPNLMASNKRDPLCATMVGSVVFLVTLNVRDLRQGYDLADNMAHAMTPITSNAH